MIQATLSAAPINIMDRTDNATINKYFLLFCLLHLVLWTVAITLFRHTIPFDTAEGFAWGAQWQWGYDKHPLLAPWLTAFVANISGGMRFATYLLSYMINHISSFNFSQNILANTGN